MYCISPVKDTCLQRPPFICPAGGPAGGSIFSFDISIFYLTGSTWWTTIMATAGMLKLTHLIFNSEGMVTAIGNKWQECHFDKSLSVFAVIS